MARNNTYSLSWFKKRTAYVNRTLRTTPSLNRAAKGKPILTYSPKEEYQKYQRARMQGYSTTFVNLYSADPRSEKGRSATYSSTGATLRQVWEKFGEANSYARFILDHVDDPNVLITSDGSLYRVEVTGPRGGKTYVKIGLRGTAETRLNRRPAGAVPLSISRASKALADQAKRIKKYRQGAAAGGGSRSARARISYENE